MVGLRDGQNPEYGGFDVIKVQFSGQYGGSPREYAANLQKSHKLNQSSAETLLHGGKGTLNAEQIYAQFQNEINETLLYALEEGLRNKDFVEADGYWLLSDMLADVNLGYLNIAEALIEVHNKPLKTDNLLSEIELDENVSPAMRVISLNHALSKDQRFDRVGRNDESQWYLRRLEPEVVLETPALLKFTPVPYNRALLSVEMLQLEWELGDEWGESSLSMEIPRIVPSTSLTLTYPHRRYGTLPLTGRTASFFPPGQKNKTMITLVDGRWGTHFTGWVVHEGRYVSGLEKWMADHEVPVGAFVTLERTNKTNEVIVDFRTRRAKREWARIASAELSTGRLRFELNKVQVACEYDEYMIIAEQEPAGLDELRKIIIRDGITLAQLVEQIAPELIKLNPQGTVHAKSVYSAVNVVYRCPPGPIFHAMISNRRLRDVGSGFFSVA